MKNTLFSSIKETISHALVYGFGQVISKSIGFLLIPLYTRYLSPSDYGILSLLSITSSIAVSLFQLGLNSALFRSYYDYEDEEDRNKLISTCLYILLISSLFLAIGGYLLSSQLSNLLFETNKYEKYLWLIIFTASFNILQSLPFIVYRAKKLSKRFTAFNVSLFVLRLFLNIYFVAFAKEGVWGIIFANFLTSLISVVVLTISIVKDIRFAFSILELRKMLAFGIPLIPQNLSGFILTSADSYFLKFYSTTTEVGLYNLGYKFGILIQTILIFPLAMIWVPMVLSIRNEEYCDRYYSKALTYFLFIGIFLSLGLSLLSKEIIMLMASKPFWTAYKVVPLIALSYLLFGVQRIIHIGITFERKTQYSAAVFIAAAVLNLILNYLLIPRYGMMGAALATVTSYFSINIMKYPIVMKLYKIEYEWKRIVKIALCGTVLYFIGSNIDTGNIWINILLKTLVAMIFPILLIPMRFYQQAEKGKLSEIWVNYAPNFLVPNTWKLRK